MRARNAAAGCINPLQGPNGDLPGHITAQDELCDATGKFCSTITGLLYPSQLLAFLQRSCSFGRQARRPQHLSWWSEELRAWHNGFRKTTSARCVSGGRRTIDTFDLSLEFMVDSHYADCLFFCFLRNHNFLLVNIVPSY